MPRVSQGTRTNGKTKPSTLPEAFVPGFLERMDGRSELCRALKARYDGLADDLGGAVELSGIKASLLERFVFLEASLVRIESDVTTADTKTAAELMSRWVQMCNSLLGFARLLGIERQVRTVDLRAYVDATSEGAQP